MSFPQAGLFQENTHTGGANADLRAFVLGEG